LNGTLRIVSSPPPALRRIGGHSTNTLHRPCDEGTDRLPDVPSRPDLEMVVLDYFRRFSNDNHRRLSKLHSWEEKKSKTSWGAETVDYEKIAAAAVQAMKPADVNHFLVVCALVSDLYCPGYNPRQPLEKNSNLARTAVRYKVDSAKIPGTVRAELSKPVKKIKRESRPSNKPMAATGQQGKDPDRKRSK